MVDGSWLEALDLGPSMVLKPSPQMKSRLLIEEMQKKGQTVIVVGEAQCSWDAIRYVDNQNYGFFK